MSRKHRRLTRQWHKGTRTFKHGRVWYRMDNRMPKGVTYRLDAAVMSVNCQ